MKTGKTAAPKAVVDALIKVLASTYALSLKTQNFHWNVEGAQFGALHAMFGDQYEALFEAVDEIAERIRALNAPAPGGYAVFQKHSMIEDADSGLNADEMLQTLANDHAAMSALVKKAEAIATEAGDTGTADLMVGRQQEHDKAAWMLRSSVSR